MMKTFIFSLFLLFSGTLFAAEEQYQFNSTEQQQLFKELTAELRCPKCQNQNIADSDAVVAKDLREKVLELVQRGDTKQEVVDYMIDRYGYFVYYKPPITSLTLLLWILPILFVVIGFVVIWSRQKRQQKSQLSWSDADEKKLKQLIKQYQEQS